VLTIRSSGPLRVATARPSVLQQRPLNSSVRPQVRSTFTEEMLDMAAKSEPDLIDSGFEDHFDGIYKLFIEAYSAKPAAEQHAAIVAFQTCVRNA